jgi:ubiquinone/menaquinone biosynthesis C-methylase UbiE
LAVLDVGCGVGATACYLAKEFGCRVTGVDLRESMVEAARERARREGVSEQVTVRPADAQDLPFADETFDVVLCESVATFVEDRQQVADELVRVVKAGGCVGLNEEIWLQPPLEEMRRFARLTWDIPSDLPTSQVKRYRARDMFRMFWRSAAMLIKSAPFRAYMAARKRVPKGLFDRLGYVTIVGTR